MEILFWISVAFVAYTYVGYPLSLQICARLRPRPIQQRDDEPSVSMIIAAYNEEVDLRAKLDNSVHLDYPKDKLQILVVSDYSTDGTDQIVTEYPDESVQLIRTPQRWGKTGAQNLAIEHAVGDVVIFSDATTQYATDAIRKIVRKFADATVGGVEGKLVYRPAEGGFMGSKDIWKTYEAYNKKLESRIWGGVGDNGAFYAIRRELCRPLKPDLTSDFAAPLDVVRQGKRFVFESEALCFDEVAASSKSEFRRKIRTVRAGVHVFLRSLDLMNPFVSGFVSYVLLWRKSARWASSFLLITIFVSNAFLIGQLLYAAIFGLQLIFWGIAILGVSAGDVTDKVRTLSIPKNFMLVNIAAMCGVLACALMGNREIWTPQR